MIKKNFLYFINVFFSTLLICLVFADVTRSETADASYELGIARAEDMIGQSDYHGAIQELRQILYSRPQDERALLYLGIALSRSGDGGAEDALKKALSINPENPRTNLELGIYYFNNHIYDKATLYFDKTLKLSTDAEVIAKTEEYLKAIKNMGQRKRAALNISIGGQYDSNVVLKAEEGPLPEGISRKSDWRAIGYIQGMYNLIEGTRGHSSARYSLYQSLHAKLSDFNITSHLLELDGIFKFSQLLSVKGMYSFEHVSVGGDAYSYAHSLSPTLIISEGSGFSTAICYRYRKNHFTDTELFENNSDRRGHNNLVGITQNIPLSTHALLRLGYSHDEDYTKEDFWDYSGDKGALYLHFGFPKNLALDLYGEYYEKDYKGIYPGSGKERKDEISTASITLTIGFAQKHSISIGQLYSDNRSNIDTLDYGRAITSLFFNMRF